jgi:hypothetical protein
MDEAAEVVSRMNEVESLLGRKDKTGALTVSLKNPPTKADAEVKVRTMFMILDYF